MQRVRDIWWSKPNALFPTSIFPSLRVFSAFNSILSCRNVKKKSFVAIHTLNQPTNLSVEPQF